MTPFVQDSDFTLYVGDVRDVLAGLPDESVHCVVTSPPYWGLRNYGTDGQIGLEASPDEFVQAMIDVFREVRRVLRRDGTLWLNLGDSYANDTKWGGTTGGKHVSALHTKHHDGCGAFGRCDCPAGGLGRGKRQTGLKAKDLVGIPWRVAFALQADGWYLRSDIVWSKPNPMPESVTDRPTKAHEYVFLLTRSPRYFFDQEAVREKYQPSSIERARYGRDDIRTGTVGHLRDGMQKGVSKNGAPQRHDLEPHPAGRNIRSVWELATQPYPEAHFATFPEALPERCIRAGTSERGCCPECGAPWERVSGRDEQPQAYEDRKYDRSDPKFATKRNMGARYQAQLDANPIKTLGWVPSCKCSHGDISPAEPGACVVLDPFMGSGTTALVARRLGRRSIGVELNQSYAELAARRLQQLSLLADAR